MDNPNTPTPQQYPPITLGEWMLTLLLCVIPLVNIVMLLVWAFSGNTNPSKANWAKASLIWFVIGIVLWFVAFATIFSTLMHSTQ
jgi:hypothetical protein